MMVDTALSDTAPEQNEAGADATPLNVALREEVAKLADELKYMRRKLAEEISRREMTERALEGLSRHDMLTMLPNRGLFEERLGQALARRADGAKLAVMVLNLDRFKAINDLLGHTIGDLLLREVAQRVNGCLRDSDLAGRLGGDEFLVLLEPLDGAAEAVSIAEKIIAAANEPFTLAGHPCAIGLSIGIGVAPEHGADHETLVQNAHRAVARAKQSGRNTARVYEA